MAQNYLKKIDIKPFKTKYYPERKGPDFENKMQNQASRLLPTNIPTMTQKILDAKYPEDDTIRLILNNHSMGLFFKHFYYANPPSL